MFQNAVFQEVTHGLFTFSSLSLLAVHELHGGSKPPLFQVFHSIFANGNLKFSLSSTGKSKFEILACFYKLEYEILFFSN